MPPSDPPSPTRPHGLCRDCLTERPVAPDEIRPRCRACGSPRLLVHPERDTLSIAHIDCDAFYAAIEKRDDPSLADKPVIVGGAKRGVVSTACYVARTYGIRSAMPMFQALKACPHAIVIKPNMEKYVAVGRQVRALMLELTPLVEPISIDEAFLDLSGTQRVHHASPAVTLARFARRVESELGITVSIGLSINKFLAKIASDLDKPRGFAVIGADEAADFLADKPVAILPGVGRATQERLARAGIPRIADLRRFDITQLFKNFGSDGARLHKLAHGLDERKVSPERETKSVSAETTFDTDISDAETLVPILMRLSEKVASRMRKADLAGRSVTLKLKTADFQLRTRSHSGFAATQLSQRIFQMGRELLLKELDGTRYRLMGIGMSDLCEGVEADRGDLVDTGTRLEVLREGAIDKIRDKFGAAAIQRGLVFGAGKKG